VTGWNLEYYPDLLARLEVSTVDERLLPHDTLVLTSQGSSYSGSLCKDPGCEWWQKVAGLMAKHYTIVQVGCKDDRKLVCASYWYLGHPPSVAYAILKQCSLAVLMENGLAHLAGMAGAKTYVLHLSKEHARPHNVWYPGHSPVDCTVGVPTPEQMVEHILRWVKE